MCREGRLTASTFIEFLERLLLNQRAPIFLVVDGSWSSMAIWGILRQRSSDSQPSTATGCGCHLPAYSPDLNRDELVWAHLRHHKVGKATIKGPEHLKRLVIGFLRSLQKMPALVCALFRHPSTCYAA
jgi:transposase